MEDITQQTNREYKEHNQRVSDVDLSDLCSIQRCKIISDNLKKVLGDKW